MTYTELQQALKANGYTGKLNATKADLQAAHDEMNTVQKEDTSMANDTETTSIKAVDNNFTDNLTNAYQRGVLYRAATTTGGDIKPLQRGSLLRFLTLPLEHQIKPFTFSFTIGTGDNKKTIKHNVRVLSLQEDSLILSLSNENVDYTAYLDRDENYKLTVELLKDGETTDNVYPLAQWVKLWDKAISSAANLPLTAMHRQGLVSTRLYALAVWDTLVTEASKSCVSSKKDEESGRMVYTPVQMNKEQTKVLAQLMYSTLENDNKAELFSTSAYIKRYCDINWSLIRDYAEIEESKKETAGLLPLPV